MASAAKVVAEEPGQDHVSDEEDMDEDINDYYNDFDDYDVEHEELGDPESFDYELLKVCFS